MKKKTYLVHHGVKGMKWGRHKSTPGLPGVYLTKRTKEKAINRRIRGFENNRKFNSDRNQKHINESLKRRGFAKESKSGKEIYKSLNPEQKLQVIRDVKIQRGKEAAAAFLKSPITALTVATVGVTSVVDRFRKKR